MAGSLRSEIEQRRGSGEFFSVREIVATVVPFITELADNHQAGEMLFVHPSSIVYDVTGLRIDNVAAKEMPAAAHDRACLAPEERSSGQPGDARASVFSIGALLYEMSTGAAVGPGMRRPSDMVDGVSERFELVLGKALVTDIQHRPADLAALAQALHHCAPMASIPPPEANMGLDEEDFMVDVSMSMMPPAPTPSQAGAIPAPGRMPSMDGVPQSTPSAKGSTAQLAEKKAALESDPRPRYVVIKDGMDHGPFSAVELLQQIANNSFNGENTLRDTISQQEMPIEMWDEFAPFADHSSRNREVKKERKALEQKVVQERTSTQNKALIGGAGFVLVIAAVAGWWFRSREDDSVRVGVSADEAQTLDFEGLDTKRGGGRGKFVGGGKGKSGAGRGSGSHPQVSGGGSCEAAARSYVLNYDTDAPPDLSAGAYAAVLGRGTYLNSCGVPPNMSVSVCVAVQNGRAVGVTVVTKPASGGIAGCVRGAVASLGYPSHPRLDVTRTFFKAQ
jgi:hypothetical protein